VAETMASTARLEIWGVVANVPGDVDDDDGGSRGAGVDTATAGPRWSSSINSGRLFRNCLEEGVRKGVCVDGGGGGRGGAAPRGSVLNLAAPAPGVRRCDGPCG